MSTSLRSSQNRSQDYPWQFILLLGVTQWLTSNRTSKFDREKECGHIQENLASLATRNSSDTLLFIFHKSFQLCRKQEEKKKKKKYKTRKFPQPNPISWNSQMADAWDWNPPLPPSLRQQSILLCTLHSQQQGNSRRHSGALELTMQFLHPQLEQQNLLLLGKRSKYKGHSTY